MDELQHLTLQKLSFERLQERFQLNQSHVLSLEEDIKEMEAVISAFGENDSLEDDIKNLEKEIRQLANDNAKLEKSIGCGKNLYLFLFKLIPARLIEF